MEGIFVNKIIAVLGSLLILPAFADAARNVVQPVAQPASMSSRLGAAERNTSRVSPSVRSSANNSSARSVNARTSTASRNATQARTAVQSRTGVQSRTAPGRTDNETTARVAQRTNTVRSAIKATPTTIVRRDTVTETDANKRSTTNSGRVGMRSGTTAARATVLTGGTQSTAIPEDNATIMNKLDNLAQMTDYCKTQYTSCMDNYCNVLDDNQGRCTCSKNIKNYAKTEAALKEATEALQEVAQQIQYIGLSSEEIETLFSQTEAEIQMQATTDNTQLKNSLDSIRDLIVDVKTGTASSVDTGVSFDLSGLLNFDISGSGFDLDAMFGANTANTSSISNQRGEQLYKTAAARCKTSVLNMCQNHGVDISVITNAYDMEIDKQCIAYERSLNESNDNMNATVRNAKTVLQKARLMVAQQKNSYDLRGCINALDSCMQDEYVCGTDYENCLDPTGKYIVNGEIVEGSTPGIMINSSTTSVDAPSYDLMKSGLYRTWNYSEDTKNAWYGDGSLPEYIQETVKASKPATTSSVMSEYLLSKIGYIEDGRSYGMCTSILTKCQAYTFSGKNKDASYIYNNLVVREYLTRTLTQIKSAQDEIISDYASSCIVDVETCLGKNNYNSASGGYSNAAINACRSQIITCMSVNGDANKEPLPSAIRDWVDSVYSESVHNCESTGGDWENNACTCPSDKIPDSIGRCVTQSELDCTSSGGTWKTSYCACPSNKTLDSSGKCIANSTPETPGGEETNSCVPINLSLNGGTLSATYQTLYAKVGENKLYGKSDCSGGVTTHYHIPTYTGYTFTGYYTSASGGTKCTDENFNLTNSCTIDGETTWHAQYTPQCVYIILSSSSPTGVYKKYDDFTKIYGDKLCTTTRELSMPTKSGYTFNGFYTASSDGTQCIGTNGAIISNTACNPTSSTTWYAQWIEEETNSCVSIHLSPNGGTLSYGTMWANVQENKLYGNSGCSVGVNKDYHIPKYTGYTFTGYYTSASGGTQCTDEKINLTNSCTINGETTWYAQWIEEENNSCVPIALRHVDEKGNVLKANSGTLYYSNSALYSDAQCNSELGTGLSSTLSSMIKAAVTDSNYQYLYVLNEDGGEICISNNKTYNTDCQPTSNTTWDVVYKAPCVQITLSGGSTTSNIYKYYGSTKIYGNASCDTVKAISIPSKTNQKFDGFYTEDGTQCIGTNGAIISNTACNPISSSQWYAQFSPITFTVNYVFPDVGIDFVSEPSTTITLGSNYKLPEDANIYIRRNTADLCSTYNGYWCYYSNTESETKCFNTGSTMYAADWADLYNTTDKALYYSTANDIDTCTQLESAVNIPGGAIWSNTGCTFGGGITEYQNWCNP